MKNNRKRMKLYIVAFCTMIMMLCMIPFQYTQARDGNVDDDWGEHQILKFTGKNATWNLRCMKKNGSLCYDIQTGKKSDNWTKVSCWSDNSDVVYTDEYIHRKGSRTTVGLRLFTVKPGKATIILNYWKGGKKYTNKYKVIVRRYENPFIKLKIGKKSIKKNFDDNAYAHGISPEWCYSLLKKGTYKFDIKMKKNWKLISIADRENGKNMIRSKKVKVPNSMRYLALYAQNTKTKEKIIYYVTLEGK